MEKDNEQLKTEFDITKNEIEDLVKSIKSVDAKELPVDLFDLLDAVDDSEKD